MSELEHIFQNNIDWVNSIRAGDSDFFKKLAKQQKPDYLWIGCSDSRVPANQLMGLLPGDVFVHRNISNMVVHADFNTLAVIQFAVEYLKVKHIIVCGHYLCGGIKCALSSERYGLIDSWLRHIKDVAHIHKNELDQLEGQAKEDRLCELNTIQQAQHVCESPPVLDAWERGQEVNVHAWIYGIADGKINNLQDPIKGSTKVGK